MSTQTEQTPAIQEKFLNPEQIELLKSTTLAPFKEIDRQLFINYVERTRLDPFTKQIYAVARNVNKERDRKKAPRWEVEMSIQVSIGGLRSNAERTRQYRGQTQPQWCGEDGKWVDVWTPSTPPVAARVGVHRKGFVEAVFGIAKFSAYCQTQGNGDDRKLTAFWFKSPENQLAKCAEALALRKAFPNELAGLYVEAEAHPDYLDALSDASVQGRESDRLEKNGISKELSRPAEDSPNGEKSTQQKVEPKESKPPVEQQTASAAQEPAANTSPDNWREHKITPDELGIDGWRDTKLGEHTLDQLIGLKEDWCDKYHDKIEAEIDDGKGGKVKKFPQKSRLAHLIRVGVKELLAAQTK